MPKLLSDPKKNILAQVQQLLETGGYEAVTVRSVAQGCGVGVGTVYNYFPSKEAMLAEFLLEDWHRVIAAITQAEDGPEAVAHCIYDQLIQFAQDHMSIFGDAAAKSAFTGSFSQYHGLLRSQLAAPLRPFCDSDFAAEFLAEALLTWSMAGKGFCDIWKILKNIIEN